MKTLTLILIVTFSPLSNAALIEQMLTEYQQQGASTPNARTGKKLWQENHSHSKKPQQRACSLCHGNDLTQPGKHVRTGKLIEPLAPSANPERLTERKKIDKWFKRNCKWTIGRECTAQEKAHFLTFIRQQ